MINLSGFEYAEFNISKYPQATGCPRNYVFEAQHVISCIVFVFRHNYSHSEDSHYIRGDLVNRVTPVCHERIQNDNLHNKVMNFHK